MSERIGQYEVVGLLAIGGEGHEVVLAKSPSGAPVAIKKIPRSAGRAGTSPGSPAFSFSSARHPNLVEVIEIVQIGDEFYRIMEYLEGENLAGLIRRLIKRHERISFGLAAHMIAEICDGLHAAHLAGELHRAVSPETVFITYGGELKLLDLGVAVPDSESLYRSPEQAGSRPLGRQSDVYSVGLVLYELTTLRRVYTTPQALAAVIPPPSSQTDSYPPQLDAICMQALARDPAERFRSAAELRDALLVTAGTLDSSGDPSQAIASKLMRLFGDRIAAKRQLLDRVRVGQPIGDLVATEVDEEIEVPAIMPLRDSGVTIEDADVPRARTSRDADEDLVTSKPWSSRPPSLPLRAAESGILVKSRPVETRTLPPDNAVAEPHGFRWGVLVLFVLAAAIGGAAGAYLRLYPPF
jgi:serine/threonine protein kinase